MATTGDIDCTAILELGGKRAELSIPVNMTISCCSTHNGLRLRNVCGN